jgi:hypothetical protein
VQGNCTAELPDANVVGGGPIVDSPPRKPSQCQILIDKPFLSVQNVSESSVWIDNFLFLLVRPAGIEDFVTVMSFAVGKRSVYLTNMTFQGDSREASGVRTEGARVFVEGAHPHAPGYRNHCHAILLYLSASMSDSAVTVVLSSLAESKESTAVRSAVVAILWSVARRPQSHMRSHGSSPQKLVTQLVWTPRNSLGNSTGPGSQVEVPTTIPSRST